MGIIWGAWHLPLFYTAKTTQQHMSVALFIVSMEAMSVLFAWLVNRTAGRLIPALLFYIAVNYWSWIVPVIPNGGSLRPYGLATGLMVLITLGLLLRKKTGRAVGKTDLLMTL
ncbi:MAG: hypothetical protein LH609_12920 [Rudanella sp.]|nr:hypothetical protein [Rudanella sp.]